jgi:hypothetical protein
MLNEERIILMTHMASYEKNEGKKNMAIGKFFRSDYITIQILKAILSATIVYGACFAVYILYQFEDFMENIYNMDLIGFAKNVLLYYAVTVIVYTIISYVVCSVRYAKAQKNLKSYYQSLKKLSSLYEE